jgi:integrase
VPGIYRRGKSYVVKQRDASGRMLTRSVSTLAEAQDVKAQLRAEAARGERRETKAVAFDAYAREWIESYTGRTSKGLKSSTRDDYRKVLDRDAIPYFGSRALASIEPRDIKLYAAKVAKRGVAQHTVRLALAPVKALLATAFEDGLIRANPSANVRIVVPADPERHEQHVKALSEPELAAVLGEIPSRWMPLFACLADTGLRIGEACALRWQDLDLDAGRLSVRRNVYRGVVGPPKSAYGRRTIPLAPGLHERLRQHLAATDDGGEPDPDALVFTSRAGTMLDSMNLLNKVMKPAAKRAGVPWAGLHTLRHTFASRCFRHGCNAKQVQLLLGHHSAAFTLETYVHLLPEDLPDLSFLG